MIICTSLSLKHSPTPGTLRAVSAIPRATRGWASRLLPSPGRRPARLRPPVPASPFSTPQKPVCAEENDDPTPGGGSSAVRARSSPSPSPAATGASSPSPRRLLSPPVPPLPPPPPPTGAPPPRQRLSLPGPHRRLLSPEDAGGGAALLVPEAVALHGAWVPHEHHVPGPDNLEGNLRASAIAGETLLWLLMWATTMGLLVHLLAARLGAVRTSVVGSSAGRAISR